MVYLVKDKGEAKAFYTEAEMREAGYDKADGTTTEEEYNGNGCYVRLIDNEFVLGKTDKEKAEEEKQDKLAEIDGELKTLDDKYLTPRVLASLAMGGDEYATGQFNKHEELAETLREERKLYEGK